MGEEAVNIWAIATSGKRYFSFWLWTFKRQAWVPQEGLIKNIYHIVNGLGWKFIQDPAKLYGVEMALQMKQRIREILTFIRKIVFHAGKLVKYSCVGILTVARASSRLELYHPLLGFLGEIIVYSVANPGILLYSRRQTMAAQVLRKWMNWEWLSRYTLKASNTMSCIWNVDIWYGSARCSFW